METLFEFLGNHPFLAGTFGVLLLLFIKNESSRGGASVSPQELVNLVNHKDALVLDVRDSGEYSAGHIVNSLNIPQASLSQRIAELNKYKDTSVIVACKVGQSAGAVGAVLRKAGFSNVSRLSGGITEWRNQNLPVVKK